MSDLLPTTEQRLAEVGLPDPYDPTILTISDMRTAAAAILDSDAAEHEYGKYAAWMFLGRVEVTSALRNDTTAEEVEVLAKGTGDDEAYGWEIRRVLVASRKTPFTYVWWTDFVANDWIQIVRDQAHAEAFLAALEARAEDVLPTDWEEAIPSTFSTVDCTGWKVFTQIFATIPLNADGTPERVEVPLTFDPDFVIAVTDPDGVEWMLDSDFIPDNVANVVTAIKGSEELYAPHID